MRNALLIIDAQVDFCHPEGALFEPGAEQDVERMAGLIRRYADRIDHIVVTLDTHKLLDIAHPLFWEDEQRQHPQPFTRITYAEVASGRWKPRFAGEKARQYVRDLEADGQFEHFIWPEHCLIGSKGAALHDTLVDALKEWSRQRELDYKAVQKGLHPLSEHFGVFRAQVPDPDVPESQLNTALIEELNQYDAVYLMGEAKSHCVANSLKQLVDFAPGLLPKLVVVSDCMSDVPGLGHLADPIYHEARAKSIRFAQSTDVTFTES